MLYTVYTKVRDNDPQKHCSTEGYEWGHYKNINEAYKRLEYLNDWRKNKPCKCIIEIKESEK